jgi:hypothetical protein
MLTLDTKISIRADTMLKVHVIFAFVVFHVFSKLTKQGSVLYSRSALSTVSALQIALGDSFGIHTRSMFARFSVITVFAFTSLVTGIEKKTVNEHNHVARRRTYEKAMTTYASSLHSPSLVQNS